MTSLPQSTGQEARPRHRPRHLRRLPGLRHQLQGVEHRRPHGAADRHRPLRREPRRRLVQPRPHLRADDGDAASRTVHFPRSCLHCEKPACVTVCPTGASYKRASDGIVLVDEDKCIGCKLCSWACPYGAREFDTDVGVMKKCTLCVDRIYNENLPRDRPRAGLRRGLPDRRAPLRRSRRSRIRRSRSSSPSAAASI